MTKSDLAPYLKAGREFMRATADPEFRTYLRHIGWQSGQDVVIAFDEESIASLISRLAFNEVGSPCLMAIPRAEERFGFRLFFMEAVRRRPRWWRQEQRNTINPQAPVGMLYESLLECDAYVPSAWVDMTFSKVPEPA